MLISLSLIYSSFVYFVAGLICHKFGVAKNYALFWEKFASLKFGWSKENYILQVFFDDSCGYTTHFIQHINYVEIPDIKYFLIML